MMNTPWNLLLAPAQWPLWALFVISILLVLLSIRVGFHIGTVRRNKAGEVPEGPIGSVVGAVLGLLAFMLAFTFSLASNRFDTRKQLLLDEVNAIGTAALRAELFAEPYKSRILPLLKQYVDVRVSISTNVNGVGRAIKESEALQSELWGLAAELARADMNSDIGALFVESLNEMIDLHTARVTVATQYRVLPVIWLVLGCLTMFSMAGVGYQFGILNRSSFSAHLILALSFSMVVLLIVDLDRATSGSLKVSQQPMIDLQTKLAGVNVSPGEQP